MTTYREAAHSAFTQLLTLTGDGTIYHPPNNGFWQQGNALATCVDYLLKSPGYHNEDIISSALNVFDWYKQGYCPDYPAAWTCIGRYTNLGSWLDDYGWWGIALQSAYQHSPELGLSAELTARLLKYSRNCWIALQGGWDPTPVSPGSDLKGGAWNHECPDGMLCGRNCITNEALWLLSGRLADGGQQYLDQANTSADWFATAFRRNLLLSGDGLVLERLVNMNHSYPGWIWTGDQGMFIAACVAHGFRHPGSPFWGWAAGVSQAVQGHLLDNNNVLHDPPLPAEEIVSNFSLDYATGKGVLIRCLAEWGQLSNAQPPSYLGSFFLNNARYVWNNRLDKDKNQFGFNWNPNGTPPFEPEKNYPDCNKSDFSQLILQVSGMSALNAALNYAPDDQIPP